VGNCDPGRGVASGLVSSIVRLPYTADGWIVTPTGASVAVAQAGGRQGLTIFGLKITGATSVTDMILKQRIESFMAAPLTSQQVTVQAQVFNNTGASITPTLTVKHPTTQDNWGTTATDVSAINMQTCTNGAWTQVAYTFAANSASWLGLEISIDFGNNFSANTKSVQISELDIRATPGAATGLNAAPPVPELRPIGAELALNQRYFETGNASNSSAGFAATANFSTWISYKATKRVAANPVQTNVSNTNTSASPGFNTAKPDGFLTIRQATASGNCSYTETWTASAEL